MSFGYNDVDWISPEYDEPIVESNVSFNIGGKLVVVDEWGIEFVDQDPFEDILDESTDVLVMDGTDIEDAVLESIEKIPSQYGIYKIYGNVSIDYDVWDDKRDYTVEIINNTVTDIEFRFLKS